MSKETGTKHDTGKLRLELVPVEATEAMARAFTYGANKYGDWNWSKGIAHTRLFGATLRHMWAYFKGEDIDPESGNHHLDHALASLAMLRASIQNSLGIDDRPKYMNSDVKPINKELVLEQGLTYVTRDGKLVTVTPQRYSNPNYKFKGSNNCSYLANGRSIKSEEHADDLVKEYVLNKKLKLQLGKTYLNRKGERIDITNECKVITYSFMDAFGDIYTSDGKFLIGTTHLYDLIKEL